MSFTAARSAIEIAWEPWPKHPCPASSADVFRFDKSMQFERPELLIHGDDAVGGEQWQKAKSWLVA